MRRRSSQHLQLRTRRTSSRCSRFRIRSGSRRRACRRSTRRWREGEDGRERRRAGPGVRHDRVGQEAARPAAPDLVVLRDEAERPARHQPAGLPRRRAGARSRRTSAPASRRRSRIAARRRRSSWRSSVAPRECNPDAADIPRFLRAKACSSARGREGDHAHRHHRSGAAGAVTRKASDPRSTTSTRAATRLDELGYSIQPAHTYAVRIDPALASRWTGRRSATPGSRSIEYWHKSAFTSFGDGHGVWESSGGPILPFYARNYTNVQQWLRRCRSTSSMPTMVALREGELPRRRRRSRRTSGRCAGRRQDPVVRRRTSASGADERQGLRLGRRRSTASRSRRSKR